MSAYLVSRAHIDALVAGAKAQGPAPFTFHVFNGFSPDFSGRLVSRHSFSVWAVDDEAPEAFNPDTLGRELWGENVRSLEARYPDTAESGEYPGSGDSAGDVLAYVYGPGARVVDLDPLGLLGAIQAYRYQACEHLAGWGSVAFAFVGALESALVHSLIERAGASAWSIDSLGEISGELVVESEAPAWSLRFVPGVSAAVSL